jgi:alpha-galactosidase
MERKSREILGKALTWELSDRVTDLCEQEYEHSSTMRFRIQNKFSVVISTYDRQELLERLLVHYSRCRKVHKIYVVWHNPRVEVSIRTTLCLAEICISRLLTFVLVRCQLFFSGKSMTL